MTQDVKVPSNAAMNVTMTTGRDIAEDMRSAVLYFIHSDCGYIMEQIPVYIRI